MFFIASISVELQHGVEGLQELDQIEGDFPESSFVLTQVLLHDLSESVYFHVSAKV